jgi:flavin reductase (DIM6/NTAB) family NADH-FMN oxidoreductase RutF
MDPDLFREVMASVPTPICVVTTVVETRPRGVTVSSFASLSLHPPMVLVALGLRSESLRSIRSAGRFALNVLSSGQQKLAETFARRDDDKFDGIDWALDHGLPRLGGTVAWLACEVDELLEGGDHCIATGRVIDADYTLLPPLTYHRRRYGTHAAVAPGV